MSVSFLMGRASFSPERDTDHQLHFRFPGESRQNYDGDLLAVGVTGLCALTHSAVEKFCLCSDGICYSDFIILESNKVLSLVMF